MELAIHAPESANVTKDPAALLVEQEVALIAGLVRNDASAWRAFATRYKPLLVRTIGTIARRFSVAAEDQQDIYGRFVCSLVAHDKRCLRSFDPSRARLGGYLAMIAEHAAYDHLRSERRHGLTGDSDRVRCTRDTLEAIANDVSTNNTTSDPYAVCLQRERLAAVQRRAAKSLAKAEREFFALYMEGLSPEQIADRQKISMSTVFARKHKVLAKLAKAIELPGNKKRGKRGPTW